MSGILMAQLLVNTGIQIPGIQGWLGEVAKIPRAMQSSAYAREVRREGWIWDSLQHRVFAAEVLNQEWLQSSEEGGLSLDLHPKARLLYKWKEHCFKNISASESLREVGCPVGNCTEGKVPSNLACHQGIFQVLQ